MKQLLTVFEFELQSYLKNKAFVITSVIIAILIGALTFAPRFIDVSEFTGALEEEEEMLVEDEIVIGLVDCTNVFENQTLLKQTFTNAEFRNIESKEELEALIESEEVNIGFVVKDDCSFDYYVFNKNIMDMNQYAFESVLLEMHKINYCNEHSIDYETFKNEYDAVITSEQIVIGKSADDSFGYCYAMILLVFFIIILYGTMIATNVTTEKSNRSIEVLVTSVNVNNLLFGKVFAGVVTVIVQVGAIMGIALGGYAINREYWDGALDMVFNIPAPVIAAFSVFGIGGFTFFACLYAAMGALVSKTEDINKSAGSLQMILMIVYFATMFLLQYPDSIALKICSYLPFTSYSAMFVRIGMGKVGAWEVIISAIVLYVSIIGAGWFAAKIYRMGTLRYGNQIKLGSAIRELRKSE